jgi:hypothetical protein
MKKYGRAATLAFATLAFLMLSAAAARADAPQKRVSSFHGLTGQAVWSSFNGCQLTQVTVLATQNVAHNTGGSPAVSDNVTVVYFLVDFCTGSFRVGSGAGDGSISGSLREMTVQATVPITETTSGGTTSTTATVDVALTATGDVTRDVQNFHDVSGGNLVVQVRSVGARTAAIPSGSVIVNSVDIVDGVTPAASSQITDTNGGTITIFLQ